LQQKCHLSLLFHYYTPALNNGSTSNESTKAKAAAAAYPSTDARLFESFTNLARIISEIESFMALKSPSRLPTRNRIEMGNRSNSGIMKETGSKRAMRLSFQV
jgi:hypothetical protein